MTEELNKAAVIDSSNVSLSALSRITKESTNVYGISPSSEIDDTLMLKYHDKDTELGVTE